MARRRDQPRPSLAGAQLRRREIASLTELDDLYGPGGGSLAAPALAGYADRLRTLADRTAAVSFAAHPLHPDRLVDPGLVNANRSLRFLLQPDDSITPGVQETIS